MILFVHLRVNFTTFSRMPVMHVTFCRMIESGCYAFRRLLSETVPLTNSNESGKSGGAYASLGTRQEGGGFEGIGLSICALPL